METPISYSRRKKPQPPIFRGGNTVSEGNLFFVIGINNVEVSINLSSRRPRMSEIFLVALNEKMAMPIKEILYRWGIGKVAKEESRIQSTLIYVLLPPAPARGFGKE